MPALSHKLQSNGRIVKYLVVLLVCSLYSLCVSLAKSPLYRKLTLLANLRVELVCRCVPSCAS